MASTVYQVVRFPLPGVRDMVFVRNVEQARNEARMIASLGGYAEINMCSLNPALTEKNLLIAALNDRFWCANVRRIETFGEPPPLPLDEIDQEQAEGRAEDDGTSHLADEDAI